MTTLPELPTPTSPSEPSAGPTDTDHTLTERCEDSGQYLAGLIAGGMLDHVGRPGKLPELLWPDADPLLVRAVWEAALATGYRAGKRAGRPEWTIEGLDRLRTALYDAGYRGMAGQVARTAAVHHQPHPADREAAATAVRPGGHP